MKTTFFPGRRSVLLLLAAAAALSAWAGQPQLVSTVEPALGPASGGGGDSATPIISPDGRFVLFASTASNLALVGTNPLPALIPPPLNVFLRDRLNGTTTLVSINAAGTGGGNGDSLPAGVSTNGQFALFESSASDLVAGDTNNAADIFVRDLVNGVTLLVSIGTNAVSANGVSRSPVMTPDGRYVAFVSAASNLAPGDTNGIADVFVRDVQAGVTRLVSVGATLNPAFGSATSSEAPEMTPDGRYAVFSSTATGLTAAAVSNGIYVCDLVGGGTVLASLAPATVQATFGKTNPVFFNHTISDDGQYVVYAASASPAVNSLENPATSGVVFRYNVPTGNTDVVHTNAFAPTSTYEESRNLDLTPDGRFLAFVAVANDASGSDTCILVWDGKTGTATLASGDLDNAVPAGSTCNSPALDSSGRFVLFLSSGAGLVTNAVPAGFHAYLRDLQAGVTTLVDVGPNGAGSPLQPFAVPSFSADGLYAAFESPDGPLVPGDDNRDCDVFVRELSAGATEMTSVRAPSLPSLAANGPSLLAASPVSTDGRWIAFASEADNLVEGDTNGMRDVFVRDLAAGTTLLVSLSTNGGAADGVSAEPAMSADGRFVAFTSSADNLVADDTNRAVDVFIRDLQAGSNMLVSVNTAGNGSGNGASYSPTLSADDRFVLFRSRATNLAPGTFASVDPFFPNENLFLRDLQTGTTRALTTTGLGWSSTSFDGRFIAVVAAPFSGNDTLFVWDAQAAASVYTNGATQVSAAGVGPGANRLAYFDGVGPAAQLFVADRLANTNGAIASGLPAARPGLRFSADGRFLAYAAGPPASAASPATNQVYLYDFQTGTNLLVSRSLVSGGRAQGDSEAPDISPDGRFVAYRSAATDLVLGATNARPKVVLYDRLGGFNMLLSQSSLGNGDANNQSGAPVFSGNGQVVAFDSWASDLAPQDFNQSSAVFTFDLYSPGAFPLFAVQIANGAAPVQPLTLTWPAQPGKSYRAQFKTNLTDGAWQDIAGGVNLNGGQGSFSDPAPAAEHRFYRILSY
jgi:Tol biopolymer transport system component